MVVCYRYTFLDHLVPPGVIFCDLGKGKMVLMVLVLNGPLGDSLVIFQSPRVHLRHSSAGLESWIDY